ncbi:MAG: nitrate reductase molybdenum cofactor assembly chaperone [Micrococcales bacterium]|nr:nitrate reductase molybdenum cofactor assembly chaperone [Micrococcales bacterium]
MIFRRFRTAARLPDQELRRAWLAVSYLVEYPTQELLERLPAIRAAVEACPAAVSEPVGRLTAYLSSTPLQALQEDFVETFDHTRRCCLYLTYFACGDTRKRGVALVQFKQAYRKAGLEFDGAELPDHLAVVLEFGGTGDVDAAWKLLNDHRAGIEMLRIALQDRESPWADAILALCATLPELEGEESEAVARLIEQGPPSEGVGLDAYSTDPSMDPRINPHPDDIEPVNLGMHIPVGANS